LAGDEARGWASLNQELHFHDLRHTNQTWLVEDKVPRPLRLARLGHKRKDVDDDYSHVTDQMIEDMLDALQDRWENDGGWTWDGEAA
jgi:integrase